MAAPVAEGTIITAVTLEDAGTAVWQFSSSYSGDSLCLALSVNDGAGGWVSPDSVDAQTEMSIRAFYSEVSLNLLSTWRLLTPIDGLTFAGRPLEVPQGGGMSAG